MSTPIEGRRGLIGEDALSRERWPGDVSHTTITRLHNHEPDELEDSL
jgi:hypothetical protein